MNSVVLSTKSNYWAWGLEAIADLENRLMSVDAVVDASSQSQPFSGQQISFTTSFLERKGLDWKSSPLSRYKQERLNVYHDLVQYVASKKDDTNWTSMEKFGVPVGSILCSNYSKIHGTSLFPFSVLPRSFIKSTLKQISYGIVLFDRLLSSSQLITLANGRTPLEATILRLGLANSSQMQVLERGRSTKYWQSFNHSPHYPKDWWELMRATAGLYENLDDEAHQSIKHYWSKRLEGVDLIGMKSWQDGTVNCLPEGLDSRPFVLFMCTSLHEQTSLPEFHCTDSGFLNQYEALKATFECCQELGLHLVVKRHPNSLSSQGKDNEDTYWKSAQSLKGVTYISPFAKFNSYYLMSKAHAVVGYKSSSVLEANIMGVPSRVTGPAIWSFSEDSRAWTKGKLFDFLRCPDIFSSKTSEVWALTQLTLGKPLAYFGDISGKFVELLDGSRIHPKSSKYFHRQEPIGASL